MPAVEATLSTAPAAAGRHAGQDAGQQVGGGLAEQPHLLELLLEVGAGERARPWRSRRC
jgi:hypothetical protein